MTPSALPRVKRQSQIGLVLSSQPSQATVFPLEVYVLLKEQHYLASVIEGVH